MSSNFRRCVIVAFVAVSGPVSVPLMAQVEDTTYSLILYVGGGYSRNLSTFETPLEGLNKNGFGGAVRVMWRPEHLLRIGLETGFMQVYYVKQENVQGRYGETDFSSYLNVVPLSLSFSMRLTEHLEGYIGSTSYLLLSRTESFGSTATGSMLSIGFSAALSYIWPIGDDWGVGCELKWYHIEKSRDNNVMLYVMFSYRFLQW